MNALQYSSITRFRENMLKELKRTDLEEIQELVVGMSAPTFCAVANGNRKINLSDLLGKIVVLYFYPKDNTTGCTAQAIDFAKYKAKFDKIDAVILGISIDGIQSHEKFIAKYDLPFNLIYDKDSMIAKNYYVWVKKTMFGRKYMGTERATFLLDRSGKIAHIWHDVKVEGHAAEVFAKAKTL
jgi:peroxiredoxin Q/BCP